MSDSGDSGTFKLYSPRVASELAHMDKLISGKADLDAFLGRETALSPDERLAIGAAINRVHSLLNKAWIDDMQDAARGRRRARKQRGAA